MYGCIHSFYGEDRMKETNRKSYTYVDIIKMDLENWDRV
jgi:hypothetical protein